MKRLPIMDIGLIWAKIVNIWGQVGTVAGVVNFIMTIGIFYTTTAYPNWKIPLWLYLIIIAIGAMLVISFILKWGISGYYRYFSNQSELSEVHRKLNLVMNHLNIEDDNANTK